MMSTPTLQHLHVRTPFWTEAMLPLAAIPLLLLLVILLPLFILAGESLLLPVWDALFAVLMPVNAGFDAPAGLPWILLLKLAGFLLFAGTGVALLLMKVTCIYAEAWAGFLKSPSPQHAPYHPDQQQSMLALVNWGLFRLYRVLGPGVLWTAIFFVGGALLYAGFNAFPSTWVPILALETGIGFFVMAALGCITAWMWAKGLWLALTTVFGGLAAAMEPEKPAQVIFDRVRRIAFKSPWIALLYPVLALALVATVLAVTVLVVSVDIPELLTFQAVTATVLGVTAVLILLWMAVAGMTCLTYHHALQRFYQQHR